jgi:hypothetical protein
MKTCWFCGRDDQTNSDSYLACGVLSQSRLFGWDRYSRYQRFDRCSQCAELHKIMRFPGFLGAIAGLYAMIKFGWPLIGVGIDHLIKIENLLFLPIVFGFFAAGAYITVRIPFWGYRIFAVAYLKLRGFNIRTPWQADSVVRRQMTNKEND